MPADRIEDSWRKPSEVLQFLEIAPGHQVLDFYAGPGYYSELLAHIVGPNGKVLIYNNELYHQAAHNGLTARLARKRLPNAVRLNAPSNYMKLESGSLDRVLIVLTYHDIYWQPGDSPKPMGDPDKVLGLLRQALRPGGLVVVVDPDDDHTKSVFNASVRHRTDQFIYKFRRPSIAARVQPAVSQRPK